MSVLPPTVDPSSTPAWKNLQKLANSLPTLRELFAVDATRGARYQLSACGITLHYAKNRIDEAAMQNLLALAEACKLDAWRAAMFSGQPINQTEQRAVLHTALRAPVGAQLLVDGQAILPAVQAVRARCFTFAEAVRAGQWRGFTGQAISDVVNIGIGGSDLGPQMVCEALRTYADGPRVHFVSNLDNLDMDDVLRQLDPARTLFIVASKTFTTQETLSNAQAARAWLVAAGGEAAVAQHFVAVSSFPERAAAFGIPVQQVFGFADWVGGRYSLWGPIGLSIMLALGAARFESLLAGAAAMDQHFESAPLAQNLPVLLALLNVWSVNFQGAGSHLIAPYNRHLHRLAPFLQQLDMESCGKQVRRDGLPVAYATGPVLWGELGLNGQHAYFQLLHQGSQIIPVDFILAMREPGASAAHQRKAFSHCLAQSAALLTGKDAAAVRTELAARGMSGAALEAAIPHRVFQGNRPSNTLLLEVLDPFHLGALLALYEHKVFVQAAIWGINAFDQWGVELGKQLATGLEAALLVEAAAYADYDSSTQAILAQVRQALDA